MNNEHINQEESEKQEAQKKKKNRYYQKNRYYKQAKKDKKEIIRVLEETGKRIDHISPPDIADRLEQLYNRVCKCDEYIKNPEKYPRLTECRLKIIKEKRQNYARRFINLSSIIIGAVVSKQKTLKVFQEDMYNECVIAVLDSVIEKKTYKPGKSKITSQVYEVCRQTLKRFGTTQITYENRKLKLIDI